MHVREHHLEWSGEGPQPTTRMPFLVLPSSCNDGSDDQFLRRGARTDAARCVSSLPALRSQGAPLFSSSGRNA